MKTNIELVAFVKRLWQKNGIIRIHIMDRL